MKFIGILNYLNGNKFDVFKLIKGEFYENQRINGEYTTKEYIFNVKYLQRENS